MTKDKTWWYTYLGQSYLFSQVIQMVTRHLVPKHSCVQFESVVSFLNVFWMTWIVSGSATHITIDYGSFNP